MNRPSSFAGRISLGAGPYLLAFLLALVLRLTGAAQLPLTDGEARLALQALALTRGETIQISPDAAYLALTTLLMFLTDAGSWTARFWPALTGSLLVLLPALFEQRLGRLAALILAFALALDPVLLGTSVQVSSLPLALFFTLLAAGLWYEKRSPLAGLALGMALLSGPAFWPGLMALAGAAWACFPPRARAFSISTAQPVDDPVEDEAAADRPAQPLNGLSENTRLALLLALGTVFFVGTLFFTIPAGLSAMAGSLPAYLTGWGEANSTPVGMLLAALLAYALLPLLLGLWGSIDGVLRGDPIDRFLLVWLVAVLILTLLYPARQVLDIAWTLLPLWALAARFVARQVYAARKMPDEDRLPMLGQALLVAVILAFVSMNVVSLVNNPQAAARAVDYQLRVFGALIMLVASTGLIAWGWAKGVALRGMLWGVLAVLVAFTLSSAWNAAGLSGRRSAELLWGSQRIASADLLEQTLDQLRDMAPVKSVEQDLVIVGVQSDALRWALRDQARLSFVDAIPAGASPSIVITPDLPDLALSAAYRGQSLDWLARADWQPGSPFDWFRWMVFRTLPPERVQYERIILWARADLFPGGEQSQQQPLFEPDNLQP